MRPSIILGFVWVVAVVVVILAVIILAREAKDEPIPLPPAGYEYCVQDGEIGFCPED